MTVLFDLLYAQPLDGSKFHGGGEYIKRVFQELCNNSSDKIHIVAFYDYDAFIDEWIKELILNKRIDTVDVKNISELASICGKYKVDVFYTGMPYHYRKEMFPNQVYKIGTFHGMRAVECPHDHYEYMYIPSAKGRLKEHIRNLLKYSSMGYEMNRKDGLKNYEACLECFDKIITGSEHSRYALLNYFSNEKVSDVEVIYAPLKNASRNANVSFQGESTNLLILGGNRWIKNSYRAIIAIDDLYSRGKLEGFTTTVLGDINNIIKKKLRNPERFIAKGYVEERELEELYRSSILIYPTLNEGFGYPPLEAMYYGSTCVISSVCSLQEVGGDAVYYVNPTDVGEIQNRILHAILSPIPREKVLEQYLIVAERQEKDLKKLCDIILEGGFYDDF